MEFNRQTHGFHLLSLMLFDIIQWDLDNVIFDDVSMFFDSDWHYFDHVTWFNDILTKFQRFIYYFDHILMDFDLHFNRFWFILIDFENSIVSLESKKAWDNMIERCLKRDLCFVNEGDWEVDRGQVLHFLSYSRFTERESERFVDIWEKRGNKFWVWMVWKGNRFLSIDLGMDGG